MAGAYEYQLRCTDRTGQLHRAESLLELELVSGSHITVSGLLLLKCKNNEPETNFTHFCIAIMFMINDQLYPLNTVGHLYTGPLTFYGDFRKFQTLQLQTYTRYIYLSENHYEMVLRFSI